ASEVDHASMDHPSMDHAAMKPPHAHHSAIAAPREPIPVLTDADRRAAFPDVGGHAAHDNAIHRYLLFDRLEGWDAGSGTDVGWEVQGWAGTDLDRAWLRSEGERSDGSTESADIEVLYGHSVARWWDAVAGIRHDLAPGRSQTHAAIGLMGLAPQMFEVEATAYVSERARLSARFEVEYELLLTNRLILQPVFEASWHGSDDPSRGIGSGFGTAEAGLRLRYELSRRFAPYVGVVHERAFGQTAELRREDGKAVRDTRLVAGVRVWF
ncbi:MAG TPA: copper resistance protein B, partial [Pseudoxanthomonas sp.]|nr:copper resistance protein B [Pseudoxanthomonas sp.]